MEALEVCAKATQFYFAVLCCAVCIPIQTLKSNHEHSIPCDAMRSDAIPFIHSFTHSFAASAITIFLNDIHKYEYVYKNGFYVNIWLWLLLYLSSSFTLLALSLGFAIEANRWRFLYLVHLTASNKYSHASYTKFNGNDWDIEDDSHINCNDNAFGAYV